MDDYNAESVLEGNRSYYREEAARFSFQRESQPELRRELKAYLELLCHKKSPARILDVGTGSGFALKLAREIFPNAELMGYDVSEEMLAIAKASLPRCSFRLLNEPDIPVEKNEFDLVLFISSLHHFFDPYSAIEGLARQLEASGSEICIMQEPNPLVNAIINGLRRIFGFFPKEATVLAEFHQFVTNGVKPEVLVKTLNAHGFRTRVTYTNSSLVDELVNKFPRLSFFFRPLLVLHNRYLCLSYRLEATKD